MAQSNLAVKEDFAALLDESFTKNSSIEGSVIKGSVVRVDGDFLLIDVGLKSEGRIPLKEFSRSARDSAPKPGDRIDVFVERYEDRDGLIILSRDKARREEAWNVLEEQHTKNTRVEGIIFGRVKGGFTVDLNGAVAFLPGSQVDIRPVRDITPLMGGPQQFQILKMDRARGNIVVSRRAVMEETGCWDYRGRVLTELSSGERQRAHLARALLQGSKWICLDESFSRLDLHHQARIGTLLRKYVSRGFSFLFVSHDLNFTTDWADRCVLFREGSIVAEGPTLEAVNAENLRKLYPDAEIVLTPHPVSGAMKVYFRG